jgi:sortase A
MARLARILSIALITAAAVVMLDVALTLAYKEPVSSVYGTLKQNAAAGQLEKVEAAFKQKLERAPVAKLAPEKTLTPAQTARRARRLARSFSQGLEQGQPLGRIVAPKMDLDAVFLNGIDTSTLQEGPGHYPDTSLPGQPGTLWRVHLQGDEDRDRDPGSH